MMNSYQIIKTTKSYSENTDAYRVPFSSVPVLYRLHRPTPSHTVPHRPTPSHTVPYRPTPSHTVPHRPTPSQTVPDRPRPSQTVPHRPIPSHTIHNRPDGDGREEDAIRIGIFTVVFYNQISL
jgi:hypothetical protein